MDSTKYIRICATAYLALGVVYLVASIALESSLPPLLQDYLRAEDAREPTAIERFLFVGVMPVLLANTVALLGLVFLKRWAKKIFLYSTIVLWVLSLFIGPTVDHAIPALLNGAATLILGVLLWLLYFTNSAFNNAPKQDAARGGAS